MYDKIRKAIQYQIETGSNRNFVIYPYGRAGMLLKQILNQQFGIIEKYVVDNQLCKHNQKIKNVDFMRQDYEKDDFIILIAIENQSLNTVEVYRQIMDFASIDRIVDILSPSTYFHPYMHYDLVQTNKDIRWSTIECISREVYKNKISGAVAEAGVFQGNTAKWINVFFPDRKLYLFDTFSGFNAQDQLSDDENNLYNMKIDYSNTSIEKVMEKMTYPQNCVVKPGWFPESAQNVEDSFCFVRLDMDLYNPIKSGLEFFYPKMTRGGYICVHDCRSRNFDGARKAVIDFCKEYKQNYMCMPDALGTAVICIAH